MLRIGLTGGIGSGKSTAAQFFAARGIPVIDTDEIAHTLVAPGQPAHTDIVQRFGTGVLDVKGAVDRSKLRARVFTNNEERLELETILHPRIRDEANRRLAALDAPYAIIVVPLLIETNFDYLVDRVLVVDCDESLQQKRVAARSGLGAEEIRRIMAAQTNRNKRLTYANDVIENNAGLTELEKQVEQLHQRYLTLAQN